MKNNTSILLIGGAAVAFYYYQKTRAASLITYTINSVALNFSGVTPILKIILNIQNVTGQSITINSMAGFLYVNNQNVGSISNFAETVIAPNSQTAYEITVKMNLIGVVSDLINLITNKAGNQTSIQIVANANIEGVIIPINSKYNIS